MIDNRPMLKVTKLSVPSVLYLEFFCVGLMLAQSPPSTTAAATLMIRGELPSPIALSLEDLGKMPRQSARVADQDGTQVSYEGVSLRDVLNRAGPSFGKDLRGEALASYLVVKARDGYEVVFTLAELDTDFVNAVGATYWFQKADMP